MTKGISTLSIPELKAEEKLQAPAPPQARSHRTVALAGALAGFIGLLGLLGGWTHLSHLASLHPAYLDMSLYTGLGLFLAGTALCLESRERSWAQLLWTAFSAPLVLSLALLGFFSFLPVSPVSKVSLALAGVGMLAGMAPRLEAVAKTASISGFLMAFINAVVLLGYIYGAPLLYGGERLPIGAAAATGFFILGLGRMALSGSDYFPLRHFVGPSIAAVMLRTFVPVTFLVVLLAELLSNWVRAVPLSNRALQDALLAIFAVTLVSIAVAHLARRFGVKMDAIERSRVHALNELQKAQVELKKRIQERTAELEEANRSLRIESEQREIARVKLQHITQRQECLLNARPDWLLHLRGKELLELRVPQETGPRSSVVPLDKESLPVQFAHAFIAQFEESLGAAAADQQVRNFECALRLGSDEREFEVHLAPIAAGELVVLLRDVTVQKALQRHLIEAGSKEQIRIGQDLHDGLGQLLTGIGFLSAALADGLKQRAIPESGEAAEISRQVAKAISWTRKLARGLTAAEVEMTGLLPALQELAQDSRQMFKIECSLHHDGCPLPADPKTVLHLYRIAQEAIHNAVRHGHATHILLALRKNGNGLEFAISDNGLGLMASPNGSPKGMGLQTMQFRAQQIGGVMKIESSPGTGTTILCLLPIITDETPL